MRAVTPLQVAIAAATLLAACTSTTGPRPVTDPEILVVTVAPSSATIDGGAFIKLNATVMSEEGPVTSRAPVSWSSADPTIAAVGSDGLVEGRRAGEVRIIATWQNARGSAFVKVARALKPPPDEPGCPAASMTNSIPDPLEC
ncbi:MAG: Ig-like domain-containing protein [Acidobacteria bacterium]|nr:Ig-like domain-containing protein [Acidobacteriota bacterium]